MKESTIKIGILNIMPDKVTTLQHYRKIFAELPFNTELTFFHPQTEYLEHPLPEKVSTISQPLKLEEISDLAAFIITGAPNEKEDFTEVSYTDELQRLMQKLNDCRMPQLYSCWGAMLGMHYFYGIKKHKLKKKIFGVYHHCIVQASPLLANLSPGFLAPHARYAEMDCDEIFAERDLTVNATTYSGNLFLLSSLKHPERNFLFSHLEYDHDTLLKEYEKEKLAQSHQILQKPQNYLMRKGNQIQPTFAWEDNQRYFFTNWLEEVERLNLKRVAVRN